MAAVSSAIGVFPHTLTKPAASNPQSTDRDPTEVGYWVRSLTAAESRRLRNPRTGDVLEDGAVVLREEDISRMGLAEFRRWIIERIVRDRTPVALVSARKGLQLAVDEV